MVKWITLVLAFTVLLCYGWFGMLHQHEQGNNGLLITSLVSHYVYVGSYYYEKYGPLKANTANKA